MEGPRWLGTLRSKLLTTCPEPQPQGGYSEWNRVVRVEEGEEFIEG